MLYSNKNNNPSRLSFRNFWYSKNIRNPEFFNAWMPDQVRHDTRKSFTLIELLVVLALVAILSVVVIITLNPAELIKQARDSNRLSDLSTINTALNLFSTDVTSGFMGTSTIVYVSLPDTSPTCANLGLPALPTSTIVYTYNCVTTANLRNTDGTGWIPVNFQQISSNSPISQLPIDPINTTSTGNYYTYVSGGSWILTAIPESQKQKAELSLHPQITNYPGVIGMGNNMSLSPLYNPNGLVGYWSFDEGGGTVVKDSSGQGNNGTWNGTGPKYTSGKVGPYAGIFNGTNDYVGIGTSSIYATGTMTISFWFKNSAPAAQYDGILAKTNGAAWAQGWGFFYTSASSIEFFAGNYSANGAVSAPTPTTWNHVVGVADGVITKIYINGIVVNGTAQGASLLAGADVNPGEFGRAGGDAYDLNGSMDDIRIYNRALSAAEVSALYNATK